MLKQNVNLTGQLIINFPESMIKHFLHVQYACIFCCNLVLVMSDPKWNLMNIFARKRNLHFHVEKKCKMNV
jgi:hypothetical protein